MPEDKKNMQALIDNVERYLAVNPDWGNAAWFTRATAYWEIGNKKPMAALAYYDKGVKAASVADYVEAIHLYEKAAHLDAGFPWSANNLAWTLATCPDERLRDGRIAMLYSQCALGVPKVHVADFISTLAAAHAAVEDFETALLLCEKVGEIWPTEETEQMRYAFAGRHRTGEQKDLRSPQGGPGRHDEHAAMRGHPAYLHSGNRP